MVDLKYIGHSAFEIKNGDSAVLIDPLVSINKKYKWKDEPITDILLTHAHGDHLGEAIEIAKKKDAEITAIVELAGYCSEQGACVNKISVIGSSFHLYFLLIETNGSIKTALSPFFISNALCPMYFKSTIYPPFTSSTISIYHVLV